MKKQLLLILLLILQSFALLLPPVGSDWIIDGDVVYFEDENVFLSVQPHTIIQDTWVTFKLRSKDYEGDIDACWLFDTTNCKPKKPVYYKVGDEDWQLLTKEFTVEIIDFENMTKAYLLKNINIQKDVNYSLKCFVDIKFNTQGKYWWGVKPSALGWANGYYIDPWWNSSWDYYGTLTINPTYIDTDLTNFPVLVNVSATISAKCDSGNSIRFLNTDNTTEYYYEIEDTWNAASYNFVWVNITQVNSSSDTRFLMYYGNSGASDNQSRENVWNDGYKLVSHLNTSDSTTVVIDSTSNHNNGTKLANAEPAQATGIIGYGQNYDGSDDNISYSNIGDTFWGLEAWIKPAAEINKDSSVTEFLNVRNTNLYGVFGISTGNLADETFCLSDGSGDGRIGITENITASWHLLSASWDDNQFQIYLDGVNLTEITSSTTSQQTMSNLILGDFAANSVQDMDVDEFRVSIVKRNDSWMKAVFHSGNQTPGFFTFGSEIVNTSIITNATTGIELTNATARGYIDDIAFSGNYNYGFWIGQTTPVTGENADQNVTGVGTIAAGSNFSYNILSLSEGTHYYVVAWVKNATYFGSTSSSNQDDFWTKCDVPTGFTATASGCNVVLAWTKGTGADKTTVVRKADSYPTSQTDGTVVYNNTASSYSDTTGSGSHQYYRGWSWAGDKHSDENASANVAVPPCPPTSITGSIVANGSLNVSWTKGTGAVNTLVVRKIDSSPSSPTDGTVLYNDTGVYTITSDLSENYYRLWSYANETYSSSVALDYGALVVSCYDEETNDSLYFDVFVSNQSGSQTYESKNNTNPLTINVADDLPIDDKVSIRVSAASNYSDKTETFTGYSVVENSTITYVILLQIPESKALTNVTCTNTTGSTNSYPAFTLVDDVITILADAADEFDEITVTYIHYEYGSRTYYRDLTTNHIFVLNAYLPSAEDKELYKLIVLNQFDSPVEDVYIQIKRSVNGTYVVISSLYTDASGRIDVYLIPEEQYKVTISKSGYETKTSDFIPPQIIYAEDRTHIFRLNFEIPPEEPEINIWDIITFDAYFLENDNNTLYVTYQDSSGNSTQVQIRIYQNGTALLYNNTFLNNNSFTIEWTEANHILYDYLVRLDIYNHSNLDNQSSTIILSKAIPSKQQFILDLEFDLGAILGDLGEHPLGWVNCVVFFFGVFIIVTFGKYWAGLALIALGLLLGLFEIIIGLPGFTGSQIAAIAFMILFGFLVEVAKYKKTVRL